MGSRRLGIVLIADLVCCPAAVAAQSYPTKPVRLIVPYYPPGGGNGTL
jgi:tripartite-type tricarboxylate transporter receptor subunit TctC